MVTILGLLSEFVILFGSFTFIDFGIDLLQFFSTDLILRKHAEYLFISRDNKIYIDNFSWPDILIIWRYNIFFNLIPFSDYAMHNGTMVCIEFARTLFHYTEQYFRLYFLL